MFAAMPATAALIRGLESKKALNAGRSPALTADHLHYALRCKRCAAAGLKHFSFKSFEPLTAELRPFLGVNQPSTALAFSAASRSSSIFALGCAHCSFPRCPRSSIGWNPHSKMDRLKGRLAASTWV
jgi:hypothetical protein